MFNVATKQTSRSPNFNTVLDNIANPVGSVLFAPKKYIFS